MSDGFRLEQNTQFRYTPDPGTVEGPVFCGVCGDKMNEKRNVDGPRGYVQAVRGGTSKHDVFFCPNCEEGWHQQVVALRTHAQRTPSGKLQQMFLEEADEIVETREATKEVSRFT